MKQLNNKLRLYNNLFELCPYKLKQSYSFIQNNFLIGQDPQIYDFIDVDYLLLEEIIKQEHIRFNNIPQEFRNTRLLLFILNHFSYSYCDNNFDYYQII